ncbi:unnamed protein product [Rotaria magnacalcarata]|uniref:Uncharacterized protein n=1 Tax=Rotaria magnacalcarata TaxID=392030 RepID=A0A8S3GR24_9BILA|nr:unnamed protein product [Rotaria magnacalcarata]
MYINSPEPDLSSGVNHISLSCSDQKLFEKYSGSLYFEIDNSYNAMMKGYIENKTFEKALDLFEQIDIELNDVTYTIAFNACAKLCNDRAMKIGKKATC